jgi:hypothetical protein
VITKPLFMSAEHVEAMNRLLAVDAESKTQCARLPRPYWMVHELDDGGRTVWWTLELNPREGMRFSLVPPPVDVQADIVMRGFYSAVVEATRRRKSGEEVPYPVSSAGDLQSMAIFGPALEAGRRAAMLETRFPLQSE